MVFKEEASLPFLYPEKWKKHLLNYEGSRENQLFVSNSPKL